MKKALTTWASSLVAISTAVVAQTPQEVLAASTDDLEKYRTWKE